MIDNLCGQAGGDNTTLTCFYFNFSARREQSPVNMLGSLLKQLVSGLEIPDTKTERILLGEQGLQVSTILKVLRVPKTARSIHR